MQNRKKPTDKNSPASATKDGVVRNLGMRPDRGVSKGSFVSIGPNGTSHAQVTPRPAAKPAATEYDHDMRILEEIGKTDHAIFAALAK